ncbi:MAG: NAD(P)-dependent oxidoreductase [Desulfobacterales bacterium]
MQWKVHHPEGRYRVLVTKNLPGSRWLEILVGADCRTEVCQSREILSGPAIQGAMGQHCHGVLGQLTEDWDSALLTALKEAGGVVFSDYAVGYNNVDLDAATRLGLAVGNTPGVLTEATAEMAVALTFAAARRVGEGERYVRAGKFSAWHVDLLLGKQLARGSLGIIGAGRIGSAYALMMVQGHGMDLIYFSPTPKPVLEARLAAFNRYLSSHGERPLACRRAATVEELLGAADVVSIHTPLNDATRHLLDARRLALMKPDAVLVNTSRGPVIDEQALVAHCRANPGFRAGLDVFEDEPALAPGLAELENVVRVPHLGSATGTSREGMALLAAANLVGVLRGDPVWNRADITPFLQEPPPRAAPSIVNAKALGLEILAQ